MSRDFDAIDQADALYTAVVLIRTLAASLEAAEQRITALEARVGALESPIDGPSTLERVETLETRAYRHAMERREQ